MVFAHARWKVMTGQLDLVRERVLAIAIEIEHAIEIEIESANVQGADQH